MYTKPLYMVFSIRKHVRLNMFTILTQWLQSSNGPFSFRAFNLTVQNTSRNSSGLWWSHGQPECPGLYVAREHVASESWGWNCILHHPLRLPLQKEWYQFFIVPVTPLLSTFSLSITDDAKEGKHHNTIAWIEPITATDHPQRQDTSWPEFCRHKTVRQTLKLRSRFASSLSLVLITPLPASSSTRLLICLKALEGSCYL